jgi:hypothetical protein
MKSELGVNLSENEIPLIHEISDDMAYRIITSISDSAKDAISISMENKIPLSSTYKKIKRLQKYGIVKIYRSEMDGRGKKVLLYRSNIASFEFKIEKAGPRLYTFSNSSIR